MSLNILIENDESNEIIPSDLYNADEGKLLASLSWLITKVYKSNIPDILINPCYKDGAGVHLKPGTVESLVSGELYSAALSAIFPDQKFTNKGHAHVIRALNNFCLLPLQDSNGQQINENILSQTTPFQLVAHLTTIDGLMTAYVRNSISVERVVQCLKKYANVHPNEMPCDDEDALLFWINKICSNVRDNFDKTRSSKSSETQPLIPEMDDLYEDIYDGICLATVLSFYAPEKLNINDICFNDPTSSDDCLHNLRLIKKFCRENFAWKIFHFAYEDILYMHESLQGENDNCSSPFLMQPNVSAFVADLFNAIETTPSAATLSSPPAARLSKQFANKINSSNDQPMLQQQHNLVDKPSPPRTFTRQQQKPVQANNNSSNSKGILSPTSQNAERYKKESPLTLNLSLASENNHAVRKSPTTTFNTLSPKREGAAVNLTSPYQRSESLPGNQILRAANGAGGKTAPSWSVRMQLEEKRRQIENQKMAEKSEKFKQIRDTNKEAFLTLYGKKTPPVSAGSPTGAAAKLIRPTSTPNRQNDQNQQQSRSLKDYDEISKSILEIKEQMKRLSVEQEKLQNLVVPSPTAPQPPKISSPQNSTPQPLLVSTAASGGSSFHLHAENEPPSRLDPSLELTKNLTNWGMTYRVSKTPRKTWDNQMFAAAGAGLEVDDFVGQKENENNSNLANKNNNNNHLNNNNNERQSLTRMLLISNGNLAHDHQQQFSSPSGLNAPFVINETVLNAGIPSTSDAVPAEPGLVADCRELSPIYVGIQQQSPHPAAAFSLTLPMSPNDKSSTPVSATFQQQTNKECSPGVGFVVGEDERRKEEELNKKKDQIMAAALRRKAELENKKAKMENENSRRQEEQLRKQEEEEQKKKDKELRRLKVFEQYQKRKAEQEALEQSGGVVPPSPSSAGPKAAPRTNRGHSQPPFRQARPASQVVSAKTGLSSNGPGSVDNLDLIDGKSQSSDGGGSAGGGGGGIGGGGAVEPSLKLFVKPTQKSNRNIVYNAIQFSVLAGFANTDKKNKVLEELAKSDSKHFLILFRDQKCQFRGLYSWDEVSDTVHKLHGVGPKSCSEKFMKLLFKYDSGAKQFAEIPAKHLSATIDGFTIKDEYWQEKKPLYAKSISMGK